MDKCGYDFRTGEGFVSSLNTGPSCGEKKLFYIQRLKSVLLNLEKIKEHEFKNTVKAKTNNFSYTEKVGSKA
jgi:hypothetical protein